MNTTPDRDQTVAYRMVSPSGRDVLRRLQRRRFERVAWEMTADVAELPEGDDGGPYPFTHPEDRPTWL